MIARKYPAYKPSSAEWIEEIPAGWNIVPLWALFRRVKRSGYADERLLSVYRDYGVIPKDSRTDNFNKPSDDLSNYQLVEPYDLVINKMKAWQGSVAISEYRGIVSPAYFVFRAYHNEHPRFLHYLFRSLRYITGYLAISKGIRPNQWDLDPEAHSRLPVVIPPLSDQSAIAAFLNRETAKIDALIAEQERLIALLHEKRQAVISQAVTKGLDLTVPMKDSGVEWLGEVPKAWNIKSLRRICLDHRQGYYTSDGYSDTGIRLLRITDIQGDGKIDFSYCPRLELKSEQVEFHLKAGDFVFARTGGAGTFGLVVGLDEPAIYASYLIRFRFSQEVVPTFLKYFFSTNGFQSNLRRNIHGGVNQNVHAEDVKNQHIALPSSEEQSLIVCFLEQKTTELDKLRDYAARAITLLRERRSALISAAVTGKIDVREIAAIEPAAA